MSLTSLIKDYSKSVKHSSIHPNPVINGRYKFTNELDGKFNAEAVIGHGGEAVAVKLAGGDVLKLGHAYPREINPYYAPFINPGVSGNCPYLVQPFVDMSATEKEIKDFVAILEKHGFVAYDVDTNNAGYLNGRLVIVDYNSVTNDPATIKLILSLRNSVNPSAAMQQE